MTTTIRRIDPERLKEGQLKELASRINRLSYRDMLKFAGAVSNQLRCPTDQTEEIANAMLDWADNLGTAPFDGLATR